MDAPSGGRAELTAPRPARLLFGLLILADAGVLAAHVVNELGGFHAVEFNLDEEANVPTWLSSTQFFVAGAAAALAGSVSEGRRRGAWWVLAAVLVFLSADETALIHEKIADHVGSALGDLPKLPIIYAPLGAATALSALAVAGHVRDVIGTYWPFFAGFALLGLAVLLDAADIQALDVTGFRPLIILEEASELTGTALLAAVGISVFVAGYTRHQAASNAARSSGTSHASASSPLRKR